MQVKLRSGKVITKVSMFFFRLGQCHIYHMLKANAKGTKIQLTIVKRYDIVEVTAQKRTKNVVKKARVVG